MSLVDIESLSVKTSIAASGAACEVLLRTPKVPSFYRAHSTTEHNINTTIYKTWNVTSRIHIPNEFLSHQYTLQLPLISIYHWFWWIFDLLHYSSVNPRTHPTLLQHSIKKRAFMQRLHDDVPTHIRGLDDMFARSILTLYG